MPLSFSLKSVVIFLAKSGKKSKRKPAPSIQIVMSRLAIFVISIGVCSFAAADTITATVNGNACNLCATAIEKTFRAQPEVKSVDVDLENRVVTIETKRGQTMDDAKMKKLLADAGYAVVTVARKKQ